MTVCLGGTMRRTPVYRQYPAPPHCSLNRDSACYLIMIRRQEGHHQAGLSPGHGVLLRMERSACHPATTVNEGAGTRSHVDMETYLFFVYHERLDRGPSRAGTRSRVASVYAAGLSRGGIAATRFPHSGFTRWRSDIWHDELR